MTFLALLALAPALQLAASAPAAAQAEEAVYATYDLRAVLPRWDAVTSWRQSLLVPPVTSPRAQLAAVFDALQYDELRSFELLDLLGQVLGDDLRREGRELSVDGPLLSVLAPSSLHEQVRAVLETLTGALSASALVRLDVLTLGEGGGDLGSAGMIGDDEAAARISALVGRGAQHRTTTVELSVGRTAVVDAHREIPFLFDYDVEIAQVTQVFAPVMGQTRDGMRLILRGSGLPGGLALSCVCVRSERLGEHGKIPLVLQGLVNQGEGAGLQVMPGPVHLQSPDVLARALAFDTLLPDGKALALTLEGTLGKARTRELVLLRRAGGALPFFVVRPVPRTSRTLIALDAGLFRPARFSFTDEPWLNPQGGRVPNPIASLDTELSSFLMEWLKARFSVWRRFGPWILIVTDPSWDRDSAAQLERLVKSIRSPAGPRTVGIDLRGGEGGPSVRVRLPLLDGSNAGLALARGRTALLGYDVEVAQGSAAPDPIVDAVFDGLVLSLGLQGAMLSARGVAQSLGAEANSIDPGYSIMGPIQQPEPRLLRFDERLTLPEGRPGPLRIGSGGERGEPDGLLLELTVTGSAR
jgi:hypothetical protein